MATKMKRITPKQLEPGDVLLSCGKNALSQLIRKIGGGLYSHAAVWDGAYVIEATKKGVKRDPLSFELEEQWYVDAYRWRPVPPDGHVLGDPQYPYQPVTSASDKIATLGPRFAYDELLMAGLVIALSGLPADPLLRAAARVALSNLEWWIHTNIDQRHKRGMMCSEVVTTSYWRATPNPRYAIQIFVDAPRKVRLLAAAARSASRPAVRRRRAADDPSEREYDDLRQECARLLLPIVTRARRTPSRAPGAARPRAIARAILAEAGGPWVPLGSVTPHDLESSPSLKLVGRLSQQRLPIMPQTPTGILVNCLGVP